MNKNWSRWIAASINKHFNDRKSTLTLYIEGMERQTSKLPEFAELRFDGPFMREVSKDVWELNVEINVLIQCVADKDDLYKYERVIGIIQSAFEKNISVFKYGNGVEDNNETLLGCLQILVGRSDGDGIITSRFGMIEPDSGLLHASVEAHYHMRLVL